MSCARAMPTPPSARSLILALLPVSVVLHELGYLFVRSACSREGSVGTTVAIGLMLALAAARSLALAPSLSRLERGRRERVLGLVIAVSLITILLAQEAVEAVVLGGDTVPAHPAFAILAPICVALGFVVARLSRRLFRAAVALAAAASLPGRRGTGSNSPAEPMRLLTRGAAMTAAPLAYGLASRPPPALT